MIKTSEKVIFTSKKIFNNIDDTDINKILISKKEPYGEKSPFKYFIRYSDNDIKQ